MKNEEKEGITVRGGLAFLLFCMGNTYMFEIGDP